MRGYFRSLSGATASASAAMIVFDAIVVERLLFDHVTSGSKVGSWFDLREVDIGVDGPQNGADDDEGDENYQSNPHDCMQTLPSRRS